MDSCSKFWTKHHKEINQIFHEDHPILTYDSQHHKHTVFSFVFDFFSFRNDNLDHYDASKRVVTNPFSNQELKKTMIQLSFASSKVQLLSTAAVVQELNQAGILKSSP